MRSDLSFEFVRGLFSYNESTGDLKWARRISRRGPVGHIAGSLTAGYRSVKVLGHSYRVQRIIWLLKTGKWPSLFIDHINGMRSDNRWSNLREVTHAHNMQNQTRPNKGNRTGFLGVYKRSGRYDKRYPFGAHLRVGAISHRLGAFATAEEARAAYLAAKKKLHPGYAGALSYGQGK